MFATIFAFRSRMMCLILLAIKKHAKFKLILAANRDEYYARPSAPPRFWDDPPDLLAGRDLVAGGTWMGITRKGRIAAVTNYRDPSSVRQDAASRGKLVLDFLRSDHDPRAYLEHVRKDKARYNGFNLIVGNEEDLYWYSNRKDEVRCLQAGVYGLSNGCLDLPWPKIVRAKASFEQALSRDNPSASSLFRLLHDRTIAPDELLPETGVGIEWERILSPIFIVSPAYGTRSSTLVLIDREDRVTCMDRTFNSHPEPTSTAEFEFVLEK
jgi:uncharacterized protein with NRDE domain